MRPALSVIFFTVSSGAGLGLLVWLALLSSTGMAGGVPAEAVLPMLTLGLALTAAGLVSSTFHLANPKNAWRAFSQFRTSWLSREGVLALALFPVAAFYALTYLSDGLASLRAPVGGLLALLALGVLYCTGMIYACLKTVPRWHTPLVPSAYVLLGLYSGALAGLPLIARQFVPLFGKVTLVVGLLLAALLVKAVYYFRFGVPAMHTVNTALPLGPKTIRLLDVGHTHGNFLTHEFFFVLARGRARALRVVAIIAGFLLPLTILVAGKTSTAALAIAALICLLGLLAERWLFFAEAEHVVRLYHGAARV